jgi:hypothetical protein
VGVAYSPSLVLGRCLCLLFRAFFRCGFPRILSAFVVSLPKYGSSGLFRASGYCRAVSGVGGVYGSPMACGAVSTFGRCWSVGCPLSVAVWSGALGELSGISQESSSKLFGLPLSGNSQETFRVVLPAYVPASARIPKLLAGASASANSQNELVCPSEREFPNS